MYCVRLTMDSPPEFDRLLAEGLAASGAGRSQEALAFFALAREADPASGIPHFLIGSEHATAGDFSAAEAAFANAVLLSPSFPLARYQLGLLQFSSRRPAMALLTWQRLLDLPESDPLLHFVRGFAALAQNAFDAALHHFRSGLACEPANPALSADILQLIETVQRLQENEVGTGEELFADHVLLSGYGRKLH
jgi:tetratricopeptide (TPR) repeat protein